MPAKKLKPAEVQEKIISLQEGVLTPEQMIATGNAINARIGEFCDGYIFIGFVAGAKNEPIHLCAAEDAKTQLALNKFMQEIGPIGGCDCQDCSDGD